MKRDGHVVDCVDDYLHGVLAAGDAVYVEKHTSQCRICGTALEEARQRLEAMQAVPAVEASEELIQAAMRRVRTFDRKRRSGGRRLIYTWALATAASIAIIGGLHLYYLNLHPTGYDLQVYGQDKLLADTAGSLRVLLVDHDSQRPLGNIPVTIEMSEPTSGKVFRLASFTTDDTGSGSPRFRLPDVGDGKYELRISAACAGGDEVLTRSVDLVRSWKLMLSTDKPVYQPGQVVRLRSLALRRPDLKPVAGEEVTFTVTDPKGNVIFKRREASSAYGIASADCPLADEILHGTYTIGCRAGDTASAVAVEVKPYVLPKFRIDVEVDRPYYQPGETVHGTVQAGYFFGKPVSGARAEIVVLTTDVEPVELNRITVETGSTGVADFAFSMPTSLVGREQDAGDARITLEVTVRDTAGQEQTRTIARTVTVNPIRLDIIPESGSLVREIANTVYIFASYADGRPARVRLAITGLDREISTSELGTATFEITPTGDEVALTVRATDDAGLTGRHQQTLKVGRVSQDFMLRTDQAVYDGGATMHLTALGGGVEPVFVDFVKDGQTIFTQTIALQGGRGQSVFDLPAELQGTIEVVAYRLGKSGLPVRKQRVIYVKPAHELKVAAALDHDEYRPGERAQLELRLTDDAGQPTPGAISLAAVDEAVFAVLDQAPGMEGTFFNLEQELLKPVLAVYNWTPNFQTSAFDPQDRNRFEQALFARTASDGRGSMDIFQQLVDSGDITPRQLEVLSDPNLDEIIGRSVLPDSLLQLLQDRDSAHSLSARSYPAKQQEVRRARAHGLSTINGAWLTLALVTVAIGSVALVNLVPRGGLILILLVLVVPLVISILLPSLSRARELSKGLVASSNLKGIGTAVEIMKAEGRWNESTGGAEPLTNAEPIRVRQWFPETLLWRPELITDDQGRVSIDVDLADSITTWRLTASAVAADGRLGGMNSGIRVFQPFFVDLNLPVALTRGDEVAMPAVVYNYLDEPQNVVLSLDTPAEWFELLDEPVKQIELAPGEVRSTSFRIRARRVGQQQLQVTARGSGIGDAIKRAVEVVPDGREIAKVFNGSLRDRTTLTLDVPDQAIEGSVQAVLKIYPSMFSQVLEGLEGIFQRPYGCFEQTSSTTYPNVLALDYLRRTQQNAPDVEATARQYIHLGYQRLLSFEVDGGGFDWFGRAPANQTLTAYGLMEFEDMARVHDVDPQLITRTRNWLMAQRNADGSWSPEAHKMHIDPTVGSDDERLSTTAYIAWAVYSGQADKRKAAATQDYLLSHSAASIRDPYVLALVCNALLATDAGAPAIRPYLNQLMTLKQSNGYSKLTWWERSANARTTFYGAGLSGGIETTALATLALLRSGSEMTDTRGALAWLVGQKDRLGTWHSTQATVLALRALLAGTGQPLGGDRERLIQYAVGDGAMQRMVIPADQSEVMQSVNLASVLRPGANVVTIEEPSGTGVGYQLDFRYHQPESGVTAEGEPFRVEVTYDRSDLHVGDSVAVNATVQNNTPRPAPMVVLDLPIPAGFAAAAESFDRLVEEGVIAKFQVTPRSVIVYLRQIEANQVLSLPYRLEATMPVRVTVRGAVAYEYYDPDREATSAAVELRVAAAGV